MDILLKNGLVIDGTGSAGFKADVLIKNDKIHEIGVDLKAEDCKIIDVANRVVSPGFIDMHHHGDLCVLNANKAESTIMQGCTTLVVGVCGLGLAPANRVSKVYYLNFVSNTLLIISSVMYSLTPSNSVDMIANKS